MANDIAALGLAVETDQVTQATTKLGQFAQAAKTAEGAAKGFGQSGAAPAMTATQQLVQQINLARAAADRYEAGLIGGAKAAAAAGSSAGLASHQLANLSFQINDVITMAALGADPLRILASQGGQVFQILQQGAGGVSGSLRALGADFVALLTPARIVGAGITAALATAIVAAQSLAAAQREVDLALIGTGSAANMTSASIEQIALRAAQSGQATVGAAREIALAFAATGNIGDEIAARAIAVGRNVAKVFGETSTEAAQRLAQALADPARGVDDLDKRLSAFSDTTAQAIKNLSAQNQRLEAQRLLLDGVGRSTQIAAEMTSGWENAWNKTFDAASRLWALLGRNVARELGMESMSQRIDTLKKEINDLESAWGGWTRSLNQSNIDTRVAELNKLTKALALMNEGMAADRSSRQLGDMIRSVVPDISTLQGLINDLGRLRSLSSQPGSFERLETGTAANLERTIEIRKAQIEAFKTVIGLAQEEHDLEMRRIAARTPAQRAEIEFLATRNRLMRSGTATSGEADLIGRLAQQRALAQAAEDLKRSQEQQMLAARQGVEQAQLEFGLVGRTTVEQQVQRDLLQAKIQAQQEALRLYGDESKYDKAHLAAQEQQIKLRAAYNELARQESLRQDVSFERSQLSRTPEDQEIYQRLRAAGMLTNNEIEGASAQAIAQQLRINALLRQSTDMGKEFTKGFVHDLMAGTSATEALGNALNRLSQRLADLAIDNAVAALFGGGTGGTSLLAGLMGGGANQGAAGGWLTSVFPSFHKGGVVGVNDNNPPRAVSTDVFRGARRYHTGGIAGLAPNEVPTILQKGETILPRGAGMVNPGAGGAGGSGGVNVTIHTTINAQGAYPESIADIKRAMAEQQAQLPSQVVRHVQTARDRGWA